MLFFLLLLTLGLLLDMAALLWLIARTRRSADSIAQAVTVLLLGAAALGESVLAAVRAGMM